MVLNHVQLSIDYLSYLDITTPYILNKEIYSNGYKNYYWSDDFSATYYIAQAKAGFIAVTEQYEGEELLIPEIQYSYALLDFKNLHIGKKVKRLIEQKKLKIEVSQNLDEVYEGINHIHKSSWLTSTYLATLKSTKDMDPNFSVVSVLIREEGQVVSGEIGYIIGATYTSLSGFTLREKIYNNYGTAQLVLLSKYLEENGFSFWNLGQPYMDYKLKLGAKIYAREMFLERWNRGTMV
ncbi:MAG: hypothetical protein KAG56_10095 [Sulfurovaceae bacterium]|nr:hypothetical protein [Sulfurovaceae bacterium]